VSRVIVVEDDRHILRVISLWLGRQGHEVLEACNGQAALDLIGEHAPDLVITDINMPGIGGLELLNILDERGQRPRGAVVLTSRWDHREIAEQLQARDVHVMPKPFSPTYLAEVVSILIKGGDDREGAPAGPSEETRQ
jgi:CheY-like chemotaxis protein